MDTPEVHTPHVPHRRPVKARHGLPHWLELTVAVTALITSICSIAIAIEHGHTMEKLVQASTVPYLEGSFSDTATDGSKVLSLDLLNRGVGPAHEESMRVRVDGHVVRNLKELTAATLGPQNGAEAFAALQPSLVASRRPKRFVAAGASQSVFRYPRTPENAHWWDLLSAQQSRWNVEFCYCSVFDECWFVHGTQADDTSVKQCTRDEATEFTP
jgi:hypothetical protein